MHIIGGNRLITMDPLQRNVSDLNSFQTGLLNDSAFTIYHNIFNPNSVLFSNTSSAFGIPVGLLKFYLHGVGVTSLCVFGLIGNLVSFIVLASPKMRNSSPSYYLRCLAVCDTTAITCTTLGVGIPSLLAFTPKGKTNSTWLVFNKLVVQYSRLVSCPTVMSVAVVGKDFSHERSP